MVVLYAIDSYCYWITELPQDELYDSRVPVVHGDIRTQQQPPEVLPQGVL